MVRKGSHGRTIIPATFAFGAGRPCPQLIITPGLSGTSGNSIVSTTSDTMKNAGRSWPYAFNKLVLCRLSFNHDSCLKRRADHLVATLHL